MNFGLAVLWVLVGWCGTVGPRHWPPPPPPDPWPWLVSRFIGAVSGFAGGWVYTQVWVPQDPVPVRLGIYAAATAVGAFVASRFVTDIVGQFSNKPSQNIK